MDLYKYICKYVVIPLWAKWEGSNYLKDLKYLQNSQYFSEDKTREIQWNKIDRLLDHAYENCSFYRNSFDDAGIHPEDINSFDEYLSVPILFKEDVRKNMDDLIAPNMDKYYSFMTSGSTGKPLKGYRNHACNDFKKGCARRSSMWSGYDLGERIYFLYGDPERELQGLSKFKAKFRRKYLDRAENLDMLRMTEESMLNFARKMQKRPPSLIYGHAHGVYTLAKLFEKKGITNIRPKGIYSAGMVMHDWERKKVEEVFQCKFQDRYGCEELGMIATECKKQEGLHINTDSHYVEFLDKDGRPVGPGERGYIVITDLTNMVMPFIRYRLEDVVIHSSKKCSCGRTQPLIDKIEGRVADFLITPESELVSGISLTDHFAGFIPGVAQIQIVQDKLDRLNLRIVKDDNFKNESQQQISHLVKEFFGDKMRYECEFVDEIAKEASGKFRFTICKVDHDLI